MTLKSDTLIHSIIFIYHFLPLRFEPISSALRYKKEKSVMTQPFPKFHQILKDAQAGQLQMYYNFKNGHVLPPGQRHALQTLIRRS